MYEAIGVSVGECVDWEGNDTGPAVVTIETPEDIRVIDIAIPLPDDDNGDRRIVNATMPLDRLRDALSFLDDQERKRAT